MMLIWLKPQWRHFFLFSFAYEWFVDESFPMALCCVFQMERSNLCEIHEQTVFKFGIFMRLNLEDVYLAILR